MDFLFTIAGFLTIISFGGGHERREESFENTRRSMHKLSGRVVGSVPLATNSHLSPLYHMNQHISTMWTFLSSHQRI
ncbi:uncharacterized protein LOC100216584 isoform 1 [Zea mays]|uniref:uncharacterized protein LOC100216584 isoform 1 n=1 Tax=Zea mays TaxID=4577 RepID=UPI000982A972|nr:uncharacterized protein LOC100216584 isoform 1 [Zea mays]|eukprot:NP_001136472.2 uncharacterized protein LOC100216584 [Zea mays]